jgi:hypothetical protein
MQCSKCRNKGIIYQPYSGQHLCRDHFISDFEAKAKRAIRMHKGIRSGDHIAVVLDGNPAAGALLVFFRNLTGKRKDIRVSEIKSTGTGAEIMASARGSRATKIALATSLEEASASVLVPILRGEAELCFTTNSPVPLITPFAHIPAAEIAAYAQIHGIGGESPQLMEKDPLSADVKTMLDQYSRCHPAAPHAVLSLGESLAWAGRRDCDENLPGK